MAWTQQTTYSPTIGVTISSLLLPGVFAGGWWDLTGLRFYGDLLGRIGSLAGTNNPWANAYLVRPASETQDNYSSRIKVTFQYAKARPVFAASRLTNPTANASGYLGCVDANGRIHIYKCTAGVLSDLYVGSTAITLTEATSVYLQFDTEQFTRSVTTLTCALYRASDNVLLGSGSVTSNAADMQLVKGQLGVTIYNSSATGGLITKLETFKSDLVVPPLNVAPVAVNDSYTVNYNSVLTGSILTNDTDANNDPLTALLVSTTANGQLSLSLNGNFTYTPTSGFSGNDSFTYRASDGQVQSNVATVSIKVNPAPNVAPVANPDSYTTNYQTALNGTSVLANDTDANGDMLTAVLVATTTHGTLALNANGTFTYMPASGFSGSDAFTYQANDGKALSNVATVSITVNPPPNVAPVSTNDSFTTNYQTTLNGSTVLANDSDANGDSLTTILVSTAAHGALTFNANGTFSYTPANGFSGQDSFTYKANDGKISGNTATVTVTVNPKPNTPPVANNDNFTTNYQTALNGSTTLANDTDLDGDTLTAVLVNGPTHGALVFNSNGAFTYTPTSGFSGADSFTYQASDGKALSNVATVALTVNPKPNVAPVAVNDSYSVDYQTKLQGAVSVLANDYDFDGDAITAILISAPAHGSLTFNGDGTFVYTPPSRYSGTDTFTYKANDGKLDSNTATVSITVNPKPRKAPVAAAVNFLTAFQKMLVSTLASAVTADPDTPVLVTTHVVDPPKNGTVVVNPDGTFAYTPNSGFTGEDTFTYKANDGFEDSNVAPASITVEPDPNNAPQSEPDSYTVVSGAQLNGSSVLVNDTDVEGDMLVAWLVDDVQHGTLNLNPDGTFAYTSVAGFVGIDTFTYEVSDGNAVGATETVTIQVTAVPVKEPDPPVKEPDPPVKQPDIPSAPVVVGPAPITKPPTTFDYFQPPRADTPSAVAPAPQSESAAANAAAIAAQVEAERAEILRTNLDMTEKIMNKTVKWAWGFGFS